MKNLMISFRGKPAWAAPFIIISISAFLSACSGLDPEEVNKDAMGMISKHLEGLAGAMTVIDRAESPRQVMDWMDGAVDNGEKRRFKRDEVIIGDEMSEIIEEITDWLETNIFNEDNVESVQRRKVTYRLHPENVCSYEDMHGNSRMDDECEQVLSQMPVRFVVTRSGDLMNIEVHVGDEPIRPFHFELHPEYISATQNIGEFIRVIEAAGEILDDEEMQDIFGSDVQVAGTWKISLEAEENGAYSIRQSILDAISFSHKSRSSYEHFALSLSPTDNAFRVFFGEDHMNLSLGLSAIDFAVARDILFGGYGEEVCTGDSCNYHCEDDGWGEWCYWQCTDPMDWDSCHYQEPEERLSGVFDIRLGGLQGSLDINTDDDVIELFGLGLGDEATTISYNNIPIFIFNLNENEGRQFDLSLTAGEDDLFVGLSPSFNLNIIHDLTAVLDMFEEDVPAWLLGGNTSISLNDALAPVLRFFQFSGSGLCQYVCGPDECLVCIDEDAENDEDCMDWVVDWECEDNCYVCEGDDDPYADMILQVVQGTLTLDSSGISNPVTVPAGQCLIFTDDEEFEDDDHPFTFLEAGICE